MLIVMTQAAREEQIDRVIARLEKKGARALRWKGGGRIVVGVEDAARDLDLREFRLMDGVERVVRTAEPYRLAGGGGRERTVVDLGDGVTIGGAEIVLMAGPCAVESEDQIESIASAVARAGARILRGGAFKPRTSPYSFQGLGEEGLRLMRTAATRSGLKVVSEVMDPALVGPASEWIDLLQVGSRNMQNFPLLKELGRCRRPVLLKRGMSATIEEWLLAAEYIMSGGNESVVLCERGLRTFDSTTRNTLDLSVVPVLREMSHLPVVVDPSHGTGRRDCVVPMARAAVAAGADGVLVEVHHAPESALSDGPQSISPETFAHLVEQIRAIAPVVGRSAPAVACRID